MTDNDQGRRSRGDPTQSDPATAQDDVVAEGEQRLSQATRGAALNLAGAMVATVAGFGAVLVVTNAYGAAGAGLFFTAVALFTLAGNASKLGTETGLTYLVARYRANNQQASIPTAVRTAVAAVGALTIVVAVAGVIAAPGLADLLTDTEAERDDLTVMLRILSIGVPAWALGQIGAGATRGFGTMRPSVLAGQIIRPLGQLGLAVVVVVMTDEVWPLALAWIVGAFAAIVPLVVWLQRRLMALAHSGDVDAAEVKTQLWSFSRPRAVSDVLHAALERLDVVLVSALVGTAAAGVYGAANRVILAGQLVMVATAQALAPHLSAEFSTNARGRAEQLLRSLTGWNVTLLWPLFAAMIFGAPAFLPAFGDEFVAAESSLVVLASAFFLIIGLGMGDTVLLMTGQSRASLVNHIVALAVMLATAFALLPTVGVVGAAWAWALSRLSMRVLSVLWVWRTTGVHPFGPELFWAAACATAVWLPVGVGYRWLDGSSVAGFIVALVLGAAAHAAIAWHRRDQLHLPQLGAALHLTR